MRLRALQYFLVVAEELNYARAAERLYISQQGLSEQIAKLEQLYGVKLFTRTPHIRGLQLTYEGKRLVDTATQILVLYQQLRSHYMDVHNNVAGELSFGLAYARARTVLVNVLPRFKRKYPNVVFKIYTGNTKMIEQFVLSGTVDFIMGFDQFTTAEIKTECLLLEHLYLTISHRLLSDLWGNALHDRLPALRKGADIKLFKDLPFLLLGHNNRLRRIVNEVFIRNNIVPHIELEEDDVEMLCLLSAQSMGVAFSPELMVAVKSELFQPNGEQTLYAFPLNDRATDINLVIGYHRERQISETANVFIEMMREECLITKEKLAAILSQ
jgi:DNA-binding transcriptional LysR family regulator